MVNALRHTMIDQEEVSMTLAMIIIFLMLIALTAGNMILLKKGLDFANKNIWISYKTNLFAFKT